PHLWQRRLFYDMRDDEQGGPEKLVATPWGSPANRWPSFEAAFAERPGGAPRMGQHTGEVLAELRAARMVPAPTTGVGASGRSSEQTTKKVVPMGRGDEQITIKVVSVEGSPTSAAD